MKTIKVSEATPIQLNWLVAKCEGATDLIFDGITWWFTLKGKTKVMATGWADSMTFLPTTDWAVGGPIIARESISLLSPSATLTMFWTADIGIDRKFTQWDHDPLIAGLRCYVTSKLGETVEVPDEL